MAEKNVLVTGGSSGIGLAVCRKLADEGFRVFAGYRNKEFPKEFILCGEERAISPIKMDVNHPDTVKKAVEKIEQEYGYIQYFVNCAGVTEDALLMMMPAKSWDLVLDTNLGSLYHTVSALLPGMMAAGGGSIVLVTSVAGLKGVAGQTNYCASKAGVIGFMRALSREVARMNIRVNALAPGYIDTPMLDKIKEKTSELLKQIPLRRWGKPSDIANVVRFLLCEESSYITGTTLTVDGGLLA